MNRKAVFAAGALLTLAVVWLSTPLHADMLREGRIDFSFCKFGKADYPRQARGLINGSFDRIAASLHGNHGLNSIDQRSSPCVGTYEIVDGRYRDYGVCTQVDADGDKWFMRYETGADLFGTWTAVGGSGKYEGIVAKGEYGPIGNVPGLVPNGFKSCNHYSGIYKLKSRLRTAEDGPLPLICGQAGPGQGSALTERVTKIPFRIGGPQEFD